MTLLVCLLAGIYSLPDAGKIAKPDAAQAARIAGGLAVLRAGGPEADRAVRDLALLGEVALPAIVARLDAAPAGERLLLLAATSRMPRAAPLLEQARGDPNEAVRAWVATPQRRPQQLRRAARRYLDLLAISERKRSDEVALDFKEIEPLRRPVEPGRVEYDSERMRDEVFATGIHNQRAAAALEFARLGGDALRRGALKPDLADPIFVAYVGLLGEEKWPFYFAVTSLVATGEAVVPALRPLLDRPNHEPRRIVRILMAVLPDGGAALLRGFGAHLPETQRAMVRLAPRVLPAAELLPLLEAATAADDATVRVAALDGLLDQPAPAGRDIARALLDPKRLELGAAEYSRAARLLARASAFEMLAAFAVMEVPDDRSEMSAQIRLVNQASRSALRDGAGEKLEALGRRLLTAESLSVRTLGIDLVRDAATLLAHARVEKRPALAIAALQRALQLHGAAVVAEVVAILKEREFGVPFAVRRSLAAVAGDELYVAWAAGEDEALRDHALETLSERDRIDAAHEAALVEAVRQAGEMREEALAALLPVGGDAVRERFAGLGEEELAVLRARARSALSIPFSLPLKALVAEAGPEQLRAIRDIARALPTVEPGLYLALLEAWEKTPAGEANGDGGSARRKREVFEALARSDDRVSAGALFDRLLTGRLERVEWIVGTLQASARLLPPERLALLLPRLRAAVRGGYAIGDREEPPVDPVRHHLVGAGIVAFAYAQVEAALDDLCDWMLDPALQDSAFDWRATSFVPWWALNALRHFPADTVSAAMDRALARAQDDGRLAALHPSHLFKLVEWCPVARQRGRRLWEVSLPLCDVLLRLPWEDEVAYQRMRALGGLRRYAEAAAAARAGAAQKTARGVGDADSFYSPRLMEGRASIYEAQAKNDAASWQLARAAAAGDPYLLYVVAWNTLFGGRLDVAEEAAAESVRLTAGLSHFPRNGLAGVRVAQKRAAEALVLLDPDRHLPVEREVSDGWFLVFQAKARLLLGDETGARHDLDSAITEDRRLIASIRADPAFRHLVPVFERAEEEFFDALFRFN